MSRVCLDCRTTFIDGDRCEGEQHRTVALVGGRQALVEAVWGEPHGQVEAVTGLRAAHARALRVTATGLSVGAISGLVVGLGPLALLGAVVAGAAAGSALSSYRSRRAPPTHPRGAAPWPELTPFARGRIRAAELASSPASGLECAAWGIELRCHDAVLGARVMLRAGWTGGMAIALDNGEQVRIREGTIRIVGDLPQLADYDVAELETWLRAVDPGRAIGTELCPPILYNVIGETSLHVGDRVELFQGYEPEVVAGSGALYRDAPATILVPRTVATLRRIR
ncbi:MAG: hypothetical protein R3B48_10985 [Kofleriaceae bacterium]